MRPEAFSDFNAYHDRDRSKVVGEILQHSAAPRTNSIPWLLVQARSTEGPGRFQRVTYVQRVNTKGGLAPPTAADKAHRSHDQRAAKILPGPAAALNRFWFRHVSMEQELRLAQYGNETYNCSMRERTPMRW